MSAFTGYLLGRVQLEGGIRSEVLASLVETLIQKNDHSKKPFKYNEHHKYTVECSERGLKLTYPGSGRSKDEGFESDSESIRSVRVTEAVELNLTDLMGQLELSKDGKVETELPSSPSSPGGGSVDSTSLTSSSGLHVSDDNNSSSGNGSDSDEFGEGGGLRSPYWEILPNLSSFQSYPIEDVVFCHCDTSHPTTLVWVVRHLEKMLGLVTNFRTRAEAEEVFHTYRELRVKLKPVKYKINQLLNLKLREPQNSSLFEESLGRSELFPSDPSETGSFTSLPPNVFPTAILQERHQSTSALLGFDFESCNNNDPPREPLSRSGSNSLSLHNHVYVSNPNIVRFGGAPEEGGEESASSSEENAEGDFQSLSLSLAPSRPQRKLFSGHGHISKGGTLRLPSQKPVLMVPLKTESVSAPKPTYPKESYLYHVMGRSSSTFAPYQRSLNFLPHQDYLPNWGNGGGGGHLLVPFSSWMELNEIPKAASLRKSSQQRGRGTTSKLRLEGKLGAKGTTSKILLHDAGRDGMWASLSQRFKRNVRENLIPKLNGMFPTGENGRGKKRPNKKVTFNAWATVQMV